MSTQESVHSDAKNASGNSQSAVVSYRADEHPNTPSLDSLLDRPFERLDHLAVLGRYEGDFGKDAEFDAGLTRRLLELMLQFRAWSSTRPPQETDREGLELSDKLQGVEARELEQGGYTFFDRTRLGLVKFIQHLKSALEALAGL